MRNRVRFRVRDRATFSVGVRVRGFLGGVKSKFHELHNHTLQRPAILYRLHPILSTKNEDGFVVGI